MTNARPKNPDENSSMSRLTMHFALASYPGLNIILRVEIFLFDNVFEFEACD
jgi:hypothetical protein